MTLVTLPEGINSLSHSRSDKGFGRAVCYTFKFWRKKTFSSRCWSFSPLSLAQLPSRPLTGLLQGAVGQAGA